MYKDPAKQREANKKAQAKFKAKKLGITKQCDTLGITGGIADRIEGITDQANIPTDKRENLRDELGLTADPKVMAVCSKRLKKRGTDIKCFADLPPDVQATINRISQSNEEKAKRTKIAIQYQHLYPDRFHSTGMV